MVQMSKTMFGIVVFKYLLVLKWSNIVNNALKHSTKHIHMDIQNMNYTRYFPKEKIKKLLLVAQLLIIYRK